MTQRTRLFTMYLGIVLLGVGIVGTISGGHNHQLMFFGINMTHNMVHFLSGALALTAAWWGTITSRIFCYAFGAIYGLVTIAGFLGIQPVVDMLNLNMADNFLHLAITGGCFYFARAHATGSIYHRRHPPTPVGSH